MEDPVFAFACALKANKIEVVDNLNLIITKREDSITARIPSLKQIQHKLDGLKRIYELDKNCSQPYVLAFWLFVVTIDSLKNTTLEAKELVLKGCEAFLKNHILSKNFFDEYFKFNHTIPNTHLLKKLVDEHEIISFDIFDTLLLRPFKVPTDLFSYIKKYTKTPHDFYNDRITAEKAARFFNQRTNKNYEDITYDDIYKHLNSKYPNFKELELDI